MFNPSEHNHGQIIDVHPDMPLEPDCTDVFAHDFSASIEECATSGGSSVEPEEEGDEVNYC